MAIGPSFAGGAAQAGMPPMGSAPMSGPTASPGLQADANTKILEAVRMLEMALPNVPTGTEVYKAVLNAIQALSKQVPASEAVPGVQQSALRDLQQQAGQDAALQAVMRQTGGDGAGAPPAGMPGA